MTFASRRDCCCDHQRRFWVFDATPFTSFTFSATIGFFPDVCCDPVKIVRRQFPSVFSLKSFSPNLGPNVDDGAGLVCAKPG
jgi:hypothetical protein